MKNLLLLFSILFFLCINFIEAQIPTYAGLPDSSHVLVVFNSLDQTSIDVKNYYKLRRGIPDINLVELPRLVDTLVSDGETEHLIKLDQQGEIIRDWNNKDILTPTIHAWIYFNKRIAIPIANYLETHFVNGTPLKDIIRIIVL